jgi:hypothetical protein
MKCVLIHVSSDEQQTIIQMSWVNSVAEVTHCGLDGRDSIPGWDTNFYLRHRVHTRSAADPVMYPKDTVTQG